MRLRKEGEMQAKGLWIARGWVTHVPPGKCLLETMNKVMGNMLKHWITAMLFASFPSSGQKLQGEGCQHSSAVWEQWVP